MWPDNETSEDLIGFRVHADLIRSVVTNPKMLPLTIGVFGDWGGGKTSIMKMLERDLDPDRWPKDSAERKVYEGVAVVYIDTWLFEGYDDAKAALLSSVLLGLSEHKRFGQKVKERTTSLLKSVNWMRFTKLTLQHVAVPAAVALCTGGTAAIPAALAASSGLFRLWPKNKKKGPDTEGATAGKGPEADEEDDDKDSAPDWGSILKEESEEESVSVRSFRERFKVMLEEVGVQSLVVLVDDLDRCTPDRVVENLEAIKLFLSVPQSAFVIGADRRVVEHAIRSRYAERAAEGAGNDESDRLVKEYLEKLVQVPYSLPRLSATEVQTYMVLLFCKHHLAEGDMAACMTACETGRDRNRYGSFGYGDVTGILKDKTLEPAFVDALTFAASAAPLIADGLKGNPRQVKRFLNALLLRKELARVAKLTTIRDDVLVKLMILEYAHLKRFTELFGLQAVREGKPEKLAELERVLTGKGGDVDDEEGAKKVDAAWSTTALRRWVAMPPLLADVDLRDYFWVARDRLESTFAGIAMVPPAVRAVLEDLLSKLSTKRRPALASALALSSDEQAALLSLIDQNITRLPAEKAGYEALVGLATAAMPGAADALASVIINGPTDKMPAAIGMEVMNLINTRPALGGPLQGAQEHLFKSKSKAGEAARQAKR
jgi:hypothetical protein